LNYKSELLKGNTDSLLLCLVSRQPMYGYQIIKELGEKSHGYFHFKEGTLYPALHRLENKGLIKGEWQKLPWGKERRYYSISGKGKEALNERLTIWQDFSEAVKSVMPSSI